MNPKKIFSVIAGIILLIFVYNFFLPYFTFQNTSGMRMGMGMGMHGGEGIKNYSFYNYNLIPNLIIILFIAVIGLLFLNKVLFKQHKYTCKKCGLPIESEQWIICPRCGHQLLDKGGDQS